MGWPTIVKPTPPEKVPPNLRDYSQARTTYSWDVARRELDGLPGGRGLNSRFANVLRSLGVARGDRVYALAGRIPGSQRSTAVSST
jgi:acetyl-CoA synthetase